MKMVKRNQKLHNLDSPLLIGDVKDNDVVKKVREHCFIETHEKSSTTYAYFSINFIQIF